MSINYLRMGRMLEVQVEKEEYDDMEIQCSSCPFNATEDISGIDEPGPAEAHVLATGHHVETVRVKASKTLMRPFTQEELEQRETNRQLVGRQKAVVQRNLEDAQENGLKLEWEYDIFYDEKLATECG